MSNFKSGDILTVKAGGSQSAYSGPYVDLGGFSEDVNDIADISESAPAIKPVTRKLKVSWSPDDNVLPSIPDELYEFQSDALGLYLEPHGPFFSVVFLIDSGHKIVCDNKHLELYNEAGFKDKRKVPMSITGVVARQMSDEIDAEILYDLLGHTKHV